MSGPDDPHDVVAALWRTAEQDDAALQHVALTGAEAVLPYQVAALLGIANTHRASTIAADRILSNGVQIRAPTDGLPGGTEVAWCVRPEHIALSGEGCYPAVLLDDADLGFIRELTISLQGTLQLTVRTREPLQLTIGQTLHVDIPLEHIAVWPLPDPARDQNLANVPVAHPPI